MRKFLSILTMIALLVTFFTLPAMAEEDLTGYVYTIANETGSPITTLIPITLIIPGQCRILRYTVSRNAATAGDFASLHDASSITAATNKACEGELESTTGETVSHRYLRPLTISNGCVINQGAYTTVVVEWERII